MFFLGMNSSGTIAKCLVNFRGMGRHSNLGARMISQKLAWDGIIMEIVVVIQALGAAAKLHQCLAIPVRHHLLALGGVCQSKNCESASNILTGGQWRGEM